ncbi:MAG TPA: p-hydroxycinnamoyl-CoA synthetase, partial [Microbacterium sp.]|uniref:AMP-binding enzyme n=1 Tax=Microbacterium sp. TaxID=51671 RepID=UPI002B836A83|nr:p-hydroxycinnamoyl-CoA synthetase [Microbacterium sp.]HKT57663.1 p-hydroxycinnamoyl-CoA synthetase [Microbacterium sp.]
NIYPAEVEQMIMELPEVASVAVIGVPDDRWGEVPAALVVLTGDASLTEGAVRGHLDGRLARYKIPRRVVFIDDLPRTASGKIRKTGLREAFGL